MPVSLSLSLAVFPSLKWVVRWAFRGGVLLFQPSYPLSFLKHALIEKVCNAYCSATTPNYTATGVFVTGRLGGSHRFPIRGGGERERGEERERKRESLPFHSNQWDGRYTKIFIVVQGHKVSWLCELPGKTAKPTQGKLYSALSVAFGAACMDRITQAEHGAYSLNACLYVCMFRLVWKESFCTCVPRLCPCCWIFLQLLQTLGPSTSVDLLSLQKPNTFKIDCASDGSRGMLYGERRLYALKHRWPRLLFWRFYKRQLFKRSRGRFELTASLQERFTHLL